MIEIITAITRIIILALITSACVTVVVNTIRITIRDRIFRKYLSPYYNELSVYLASEGYKFGRVYPQALVYEKVLCFMASRQILNKFCKDYICEHIKDGQSNDNLIERVLSGNKNRTIQVTSMLFLDNYFKYKGSNIQLEHDEK